MSSVTAAAKVSSALFFLVKMLKTVTAISVEPRKRESIQA